MLDAAQLEQFHNEGYLIFEGLIPGPQLEHYVSVFDELVARGRQLTTSEGHFSLELDADGAPRPGLLHKVQGVCVLEPRVLQLAREAAIVERVVPLVGNEEVDVFGTKFFPKLAGGGTSTHWHQDNFYFGTASDRVISCGIYLQDSDLANGCLRIVPRSHLSGKIAEHRHEPGMHGSWTDVDEAAAIDVEVPGGSVVLFSANLLHGTADNEDPERTRYSTAWHYVPGDLDLERFPRGGYDDRFTVRPATVTTL
ncbi:MAG: phytanoyl-CoA dioxygenase family protein [bacterium]|nr:phytanoyl-CoA dioxygenase family protein [bacterium]